MQFLTQSTINAVLLKKPILMGFSFRIHFLTGPSNFTGLNLELDIYGQVCYTSKLVRYVTNPLDQVWDVMELTVNS